MWIWHICGLPDATGNNSAVFVTIAVLGHLSEPFVRVVLVLKERRQISLNCFSILQLILPIMAFYMTW